MFRTVLVAPGGKRGGFAWAEAHMVTTFLTRGGAQELVVWLLQPDARAP